jgi:hypothetical protein
VRSKYYREMKKFICIPEKFNGIGESGSASLIGMLGITLCRHFQEHH